MMINHWQDLQSQVKAAEKQRKSLSTKITRLKKLNGGMYPPEIAEISKACHSKLIDIITLQDQISKLEY